MSVTNPSTIIVWGLILLALLGGCGGQSESHPMVGKPAPDFSLQTLAGETISLAELTGKPVLLEFWAPWCPGCLRNIPVLKELQKSYGQRLALLACSSEQGKQNVGRFVKKNGLNYQIALSTRQLLADYGVSSIPRTVLIDAAGYVRHDHSGRLIEAEIKNKINFLLNQ